jgi:hypothetical protein
MLLSSSWSLKAQLSAPWRKYDVIKMPESRDHLKMSVTDFEANPGPEASSVIPVKTAIQALQSPWVPDQVRDDVVAGFDPVILSRFLRAGP